MILGTVVGSLWASAQDTGFDGQRLKLIVPTDALTGETYGNTLLAVDLVGSSTGDRVLVVYEGSSSRLCLDCETTPCEAVVVGIIDALEIDGQPSPEGT
jgi:microcompartment protein CcmK/EutM